MQEVTMTSLEIKDRAFQKMDFLSVIMSPANRESNKKGPLERKLLSVRFNQNLFSA
jgi:hypothetical protein